MFDELYDIVRESMASARDKYVKTGKVSEEVFNQLVSGDPSRKKKFVEWMVQQYVKDPSRPQHIIDTIVLFNRALMRNKLEQKDLYTYADISAVEEVLSKLELDKPSATQKKKDIKKDVDIIRDDERMLIIVPKSYEASCLYGANTKWCTAGTTRSYWNDYYDKGSRLYYIIDKRANKKYAVEVSPSGSKTVYDELDHTVSFEALMKKLNVK